MLFCRGLNNPPGFWNPRPATCCVETNRQNRSYMSSVSFSVRATASTVFWIMLSS